MPMGCINDRGATLCIGRVILQLQECLFGRFGIAVAAILIVLIDLLGLLTCKNGVIGQ